MVWFEKLKLNKQLVRSVTDAGFTVPKEIQMKTLARIAGGQDVIAIGPEGSGKTTAIVLAVLNRLKYDIEGVPGVLILVPDKDSVSALTEAFERFNKNAALRIVGLFAAPGIEAQMFELAEGADIVIATPDRARAIYLKLGLNLNKVDLFIVDDADRMVKQGLQLPVTELANSITKCQHLVFTEVMHDRLMKMIDPFMKLPALVEVEETGETKIALYPQVLYHVPNFATKLNLLNLFMEDEELFTKTVVFVNTRQTADKIYKELQNRLKKAVVLFQPPATNKDLLTMEEFKENDNLRVLIIANEFTEGIDFNGIPFLLHFELPEVKEQFIERVVSQHAANSEEVMSIIFSTDLELGMLKKIEQATGNKIQAAELPGELAIVKDRKESTEAEKRPSRPKDAEPAAGEAFHEKKASNSKTYNYGGGQKAKMNNKRKHS
jgi:ATP-dependent RNA helicase RhlE